MNVQIFIPCFVDQLYPDTGFNMVKVLEKAGCTVSTIPLRPVAANQLLMQASGMKQNQFAANS